MNNKNWLYKIASGVTGQSEYTVLRNGKEINKNDYIYEYLTSYPEEIVSIDDLIQSSTATLGDWGKDLKNLPVYINCLKKAKDLGYQYGAILDGVGYWNTLLSKDQKTFIAALGIDTSSDDAIVDFEDIGVKNELGM